MFALFNVRLLPSTKIEVMRQKALVRASVAVRKQKEKEGASTSTPKVFGKGTSKRKSEGKDNHPLKKGPSTTIGDK